MSQTRYCKRHTRTETNLGCGKCGEMICPQCLVHTPVGARCPDCAQVRKLPTFDVTGTTLARAVGAGVGLAVAGAALYFVVTQFGLLSAIPFANFILSLAIGYIIGEGISMSVNRRRGKTLKWVAAGSVIGAFVLILLPSFVLFGFNLGAVSLLIPAGIATYVAISRF